jgi:pyruvoyl-dependent arginine decarboxylase (PvlArgDC)
MGITQAWAVEDTHTGLIVERFNTDDSEADKRLAEDLAWELNEKAVR